MLAIICLNFIFSTIFLVNNGHRAIKVHVNKVQYCRAGHLMIGNVGLKSNEKVNEALDA